MPSIADFRGKSTGILLAVSKSDIKFFARKYTVTVNGVSVSPSFVVPSIPDFRSNPPLYLCLAVLKTASYFLPEGGIP